MKSKKKVLLSLSIFIGIIFVLTLFGQQPIRGLLWETVNELKSRVTELETTVSTLQNDMSNHTHDYSELTGTAPFAPIVHNHNSLYSLLGHDHDANYAAVIHTHDYADLTGTPTGLSEADVINLITEHSILRKPDYDSGWWPCYFGNNDFRHYLELGENALIYVLGFHEDSSTLHHQFYGIMSLVMGEAKGINWWTDQNILTVARGNLDHLWDKVRVQIWKLD